MSVEFCPEPSLSSDFFWTNFILVSVPYVVAKMGIINPRPSGPKEKKVHFSKFPCKSSRNHTSWPSLSHMPIPDLITVVSGIKYFEFFDCPFLDHTFIFGTKVCATPWVFEDMCESEHGSLKGGDAEQINR